MDQRKVLFGGGAKLPWEQQVKERTRTKEQGTRNKEQEQKKKKNKNEQKKQARKIRRMGMYLLFSREALNVEVANVLVGCAAKSHSRQREKREGKVCLDVRCTR